MQESLTHSRHWRDTSRQAHIDDFSLFAVAAYKSPLNMHSYIWSSSVTALVAFYFLLGNDSYLHDFIKKNLFAYCLKASSKKRISPDIFAKEMFLMVWRECLMPDIEMLKHFLITSAKIYRKSCDLYVFIVAGCRALIYRPMEKVLSCLIWYM